VTAAYDRRHESRSIVAGSVNGLLARVLAAALSAVTGIVLARSLGVSDLGALGLATTIGAIAVQVTDFGFSQSVVRFLVSGRSGPSPELAACLALRLVISLALQAVIVVAAISGAFGSTGTTVAIVSIMIPAAAIGAWSAALQAHMQLNLLAAITFVRTAVWCAIVIALASWSASLPAFALGFVAVEAAVSLLTALVARRDEKLDLSAVRTGIRPLWRASWRLGVMGLAVTLYYRIDTIVVFAFAGDVEAGYYTVAYRVLDVLQILPAVLLVPVLPLVARATSSGNRAAAARVFADCLVLGLAIALPIATLTAIRADDLLTVLFGSEFADGATIFSLLAASFLGITAGWIGTTVAAGSAGVGPLWIGAIVAAITSIALNLILVPSYGATWSAAITVVIELAVGFASLLVAYRHTTATLPIARLCRVTLAVAITGGALLATRWAPVLPAVACAIVLYGSLLLATRAIPPVLLDATVGRLRSGGNAQ
jgi:lipopolysaccharide exporter